MTPLSEDLREILNRGIADYLDGLPKEPLYAPVAYALEQSGKRIRPMLTLMGCSAFGGDPRAALPAALATEVFHNFTLVHDDIMDEAPLRRGRDTVHEKWNTNSAILSGDAMLIEAYTLLNTLEISEKTKVLAAFNRTALDVCRGQQLDMDFELRQDVGRAEYMEMIRLKTAVLLGGSLEWGALIAGADTRDAERLYAFGLAAGTAFQLQDDYLDVFGHAETFGKQKGGDILSNKKTFLFIRALELADEKQKQELEGYYFGNNAEPGARKVERVTALFRILGVDADTRSKSEEYFQESLNHLQAISAKNFDRQPLIDFLNELKRRQK